MMNEQMTTKDKLLHVLKKHHELTIPELMEYFSISEIAVRRQLNDLVRQKFIKRISNKQKIGRPYFTYSLTSKGHGEFSNQDGQITLELLEDLESLYGEHAVTDVLRKWQNREKDFLDQRFNKADFDEKVRRIAELKHDNGYIVELHQTEDGDYILKYYHCPIAKVACAYQQLCSIETEVFEDIFHSEVSQESMITQGDHYCAWTIKRPG